MKVYLHISLDHISYIVKAYVKIDYLFRLLAIVDFY